MMFDICQMQAVNAKTTGFKLKDQISLDQISFTLEVEKLPTCHACRKLWCVA